MGVAAVILLAGMGGGASARMTAIPHFKAPFSPIPGQLHRAGLWDKPNQACMTKCRVFVLKGCFKRLSDESPDTGAASIQEKCDDKFSLCLYDCMCETCAEDQIIIRP